MTKIMMIIMTKQTKQTKQNNVFNMDKNSFTGNWIETSEC